MIGYDEMTGMVSTKAGTPAIPAGLPTNAGVRMNVSDTTTMAAWVVMAMAAVVVLTMIGYGVRRHVNGAAAKTRTSAVFIALEVAVLATAVIVPCMQLKSATGSNLATVESHYGVSSISTEENAIGMAVESTGSTKASFVDAKGGNRTGSIVFSNGRMLLIDSNGYEYGMKTPQRSARPNGNGADTGANGNRKAPASGSKDSNANGVITAASHDMD